MNVLYVQAALYAYPHLTKQINRLGQRAMKKALASRCSQKPADQQCEEIVKIQAIRLALTKLKRVLDKSLPNFTQYERDLLDYKYFKQKPKEYYENFDYTSRDYFRDQHRVLRKVGNCLIINGLHDKWFEFELKDFFKGLIIRIKEHNKNHHSKLAVKQEA